MLELQLLIARGRRQLAAAAAEFAPGQELAVHGADGAGGRAARAALEWLITVLPWSSSACRVLELQLAIGRRRRAARDQDLVELSAGGRWRTLADAAA